MVKTKSVYTPIDRKNDGIRILATRFRGRGLPTRRYDVWMPSLGPSERLLRAGQAQKITWAKFSREYRHELFMNSSLDKANQTIKNHGQKFTLRLLQALPLRMPPPSTFALLSSKWLERTKTATRCFSESNARPKTQREVSEPGPPPRAGSKLWHTPKHTVHYPDTARSIREAIFARGQPDFHGTRQGQG